MSVRKEGHQSPIADIIDNLISSLLVLLMELQLRIEVVGEFAMA